MLPNCLEKIKVFDAYIKWEGKDKEIPVPTEGIIEELDEARKELKEMEKGFS